MPPTPPTFSGFALRLFLYFFLASLLFSLGGLHLRMKPVQELMASTVTAGANAIGTNAHVRGSIIDLGKVALDINHECTGVFVLLVYAVFVLAYPAPWLRRVQGIALGAVILTFVNIGRLILLTVVADRHPSWFGYLHEYFFQGVFIALLAFLASVWTEQVRRASLSRVSG